MASAAEYAKWIVNNQDKKGTPEFDTVARAYQAARGQKEPEETWISPEVASHPATRVGYGAMAAPIGGAQLAAEGLTAMPQTSLPVPLQALKLGMQGIDVATGRKDSVTNAMREKLREYEQAKFTGREARGEDPNSMDWWELGGMATTPLTLGRGAVIKAGNKWLPRMGAAAVEGAGYGAAMPVSDDDYFNTKVVQALMGAGIGAGASGALSLGKYGAKLGSELFDPLGTSERYLRKTFGQYLPKMKAAHEGYQERVPGYKPTVAEELAQQQRRMEAKGTADLYSKEPIQLSKDLKKVGQKLDEAELEADIGMKKMVAGEQITKPQERELMKFINQQADENYAKATGEITLPENLAARPSVTKAKQKLATAMKEAPERYGDLPEGENVFTAAQFGRLKREIGETVSRKVGKGKMNKTEADEIMGTLNQVNDILKEASPEYRFADEQFSEGMAAITEGRMSRGLAEKLYPESRIRAGAAYIKAIDDERLLSNIAKKPTFSIDSVFDKASTGQKRAVKEMLLDQWHVKRIKGTSRISEIDGKITLELPHILSRPVVITNAVLKHFGKDLTPELHKNLELIMRDPERFISILEGPVESASTKSAVDLIRRIGAMAAAQEAGEQ